ncbi:MAG: radical SAM protein [Candidatus Aenigmatarchaeota archaeon]
MIVKEIKCKSLLNESQLADYCINCYIGCEHGCKYCYADSITKRFSLHKEPWGEFVDVKINAPEILRKEILKKKKGKVFLSSLTDPYQPLEKKYQLTRKCLEILLKHQFPIIIQTKSALILRDLDLLKKFKNCEVGFTITTLDEEIRKKFEPNSSSVEEKLEAIKALKENGIFVYVFFGPILPYLSDKDLEEYFEKMVKLKVDEVWVDKLNLKPGVWDSISKVLEENYPELLEKWGEILFSKNNYWKELKEKIRKICEEKKFKCVFCY